MAVGVNIVSDFDAKGIRKALSDFKKLEGAGNKATFGVRTMDKAFTNGAKNIAKYGGIAAAGLGVFALHMVKGAEYAKQADDRLQAVAKSMGLFGAQSTVVADRLIKLADAQEYQLGILAEDIKLTQAKLLTFKELAVTAGEVGGAFDRATVAAIDLAKAGFGEATQNATQLGKALNDPIKGITALARSGVTFTAQEKEKIKVLVESGKMLEAQDTLLKAIETQVGGTAASTATSTFKIGAAFGHVRDVIGTLLLPLFERLADFMVNTVVPYATKVETAFGEQGIAGGFKLLGQGFLNVITDGGKFVNILLVLAAAFTAMRLVAIAATIAQNLFGVALMSNPIGIVVTAFIVLGVAVVAAYLKFETFRKVVNAVINFVIGYIEFMVNMWIKGFNLIIGAINILIKAANLFGAGLPELGKIGEVSFGRISTAAQKASKQIFKTVDAIQAAKNAERRGSGLPSVSGSGGDEDTPGGGGGVAKAVETVTEKLKKYIDAIKGVTQAQRSARDATKQVLEANNSLSEATQKLSLAQENFNQIIRGYGQDSKQANDKQKLLTKAQRSLEKSGYDVEASIFAVKKAEQKLAEVRADPESNLVDIREAEIALAEAKLSVADATDSQAEATNTLTEAQTMLDEAVNGAKIGSDAYTEALEKVNEAKVAQVNASDKVIDALEREKDAVEKLAEAEEKRRDAGKGVPAALKRTADAAQEVVDVVAAVVAPAVAAAAAAVDVVQTVAEVVAPIATTFATTASGQKFSNIAEQTAVSKGLITQDQADALFARRFSPFADGGIVTKPMMGLVGESGAEAIIPLDRLGSMGDTYNITVTAGMGADGKDIGTQIVNALKRYERTNGALPLTVA